MNQVRSQRYPGGIDPGNFDEKGYISCIQAIFEEE